MAWIYGALGLGIWAALAWGINRSSLKKPLKVLVGVTLLALGLMRWVYERAWEYSRGQLTVLVAARIRYPTACSIVSASFAST